MSIKREVITCRECVMGSPIYIPHGVPAACIVYWPSGEECPQCESCADHSTRNRGAKRRELPSIEELWKQYDEQARKARLYRYLLRPLAAIGKAYNANELDDEARKTWGKDDEHENKTDPMDIVLYQGRGGKELLNLHQCLRALEEMGPT